MIEIPLSGIKKIEEIAKSSNEYISLSQGAIRVGGIPEQIKEHLRLILQSDKTDYYESCFGIQILREKLSSTLSKDFATTISPYQVLPTHGCIGGLSLIYLSLLGAGDEVIIPEPSYPAYETLARASRSTPVFVSMLKKTIAEDGCLWEFNIENIKRATTARTKIIIFSNPWNPLGIIIKKEVIVELIKWCEEHNIYLVIDEAYRNYAFVDYYQSVISLIKTTDRLICANTFSKNMAMSGWRIGYLVIPEHLRKIFAGMQDALLNCLNNTAQYAALYALDHPELSSYFYDIVKKNADLTMSLLQPLVKQNTIKVHKPDGGFFVFLKTTESDATDLCMSILYKAKVALVPGAAFGPTGAPFMRLCFARDEEVLEEGIHRLSKFFL